ncbi:MAG: GTPase domain-containing protein [Gemmatimonadota bacterium]|nr:GTPase domain-containing protein [Gemmatimonadota bacterium]
MERSDADALDVHARIVYAGPRGAGKTETLRAVRDSLDAACTGPLLAPTDETGGTVLFDLLTVELGRLHERDLRLQLLAPAGAGVPDALRRRLLGSADAIVFVADGAPGRLQANLVAFRELATDLAELPGGGAVPLLLQFNKRDLADAIDRDELARCLDAGDRTIHETSALRREGVLEPLLDAAVRVVGALA